MEVAVGWTEAVTGDQQVVDSIANGSQRAEFESWVEQQAPTAASDDDEEITFDVARVMKVEISPDISDDTVQYSIPPEIRASSWRGSEKRILRIEWANDGEICSTYCARLHTDGW